LKALKAYLETRGKLEAEYGAKLKSACANLSEFAEPSSLSKCWNDTRDSGTNMAKQHEHFGKTCVEIASSLDKSINEIKSSKGKLHEKYTKLFKERESKETNHAKSKQHYSDSVKAAEAAVIARDSGRQQNLPDKEQAKLELRVKERVKAMDAANNAYQKSVTQLKEAQVVFDKNLESTLQAFEEMERKRLEVLREQEKRYAHSHDFLKSAAEQTAVFLHKSVDDVNVPKDIQDFIKATTTGKQPKPHVEYVAVTSEILEKAAAGGSTADMKVSKTVPSSTTPAAATSKSEAKADGETGGAAGTGKTASALYQFDSSEADDLPFKPGDVIKLIHTPEDEEWWQGELNGKTGMFPKAYVEVTSKAAQAASPKAASKGPSPKQEQPHGNPTAPANPGNEAPKMLDAKCAALYDFEGQDADELSFKQGETLIITGELNGWYLGKTVKGDRVGIFPSNYVNLVK
jgi:hypothetical protein